MKQARKLAVVPGLSDLTFEAAVQQLHELLRNERAAQWKIGQLYNYIVDNKLAEQNGYRYTREFFAQEFRNVGQTMLTLYGTVARALDEQVTQKYGVTLLGKLLTYVKEADLEPVTGDPAEVVVLVPLPDGKIVDKRFADCTREDLTKAIKALRAPPVILPGGDVELIERLQNTLTQTLGEHTHAAIKGAWNNSETEVSLLHVPLVQLRAVLRALDAAQA
jgi:hypothetical protein